MNENDQQDSGQTTDFGYRKVRESEKAGMVGEIFNSVAGNYDLMNDCMSFGAHRLWKCFAASQSGLRPGDQALDVAAGSGDMSRKLAAQVGDTGKVILTDINQNMLDQGRAKMVNAGLVGNIEYAIADAEDLPFVDDQFDCIAIAFGLRNVTRKEKALESMFRVTSPGGRTLVLEFSKPVIPMLGPVYDLYSFKVIPRLGKIISDDETSYTYLVESIRRHPDQDTLRCMMLSAGFDEVRYHNLSGGIVALHIGFKY